MVNARKVAELMNPETGTYLELDIYLPSLRLAFEYQVRDPTSPSPVHKLTLFALFSLLLMRSIAGHSSLQERVLCL